MGFLTRTLISAISPEDPGNPLQPGSWLMEALGAVASDSGIHVNQQGAMRQPVILACARALSETLGCMPLKIYQQLAGGATRLAPEHRLANVLGYAPNPQMSSTVWIQAWMAQSVLWGNGFSFIQRDRAGRAVGFWPFPSDRTRGRRRNGKLEYVTTAIGDDGHEEIIDAEDMLYIPFLSFDGITAYNPISLHQQGIGLALAAERFGAMFFGRGSRPSGVLTHPGPGALSKEAKQNLKSTWSEATSGSHALGVMLLEQGLTFTPLTINPTDAQFVETRKFQNEDLARMFRVPPHMVGIMERATNNNIEQQSLEFIIYTMLPWVLKFEQELNRKLFAGTQFFCKFNMDGLLRGDFASRTQGYQILRNAGIISANDARGMEGWNLIPEEEGGDIYLAPLNMVPLSQLAKGMDDNSTSGNAGDAEDPNSSESSNGNELQDRYKRAFAHLFNDATGRTLNRDKRDQQTVSKIWLPALTALAESLCVQVGVKALSDETHVFLAEYVATLSHRSQVWQREQRAQITQQEFDRAFRALTERV